MKYMARYIRTGHRQEMMGGLAACMEDILTEYQFRTRHLPTKIVVYRDGISEGQYETALRVEYMEMK